MYIHSYITPALSRDLHYLWFQLSIRHSESARSAPYHPYGALETPHLLKESPSLVKIRRKVRRLKASKSHRRRCSIAFFCRGRAALISIGAPGVSTFKMGILEGIIGPLLQKYLGAYFEGTCLGGAIFCGATIP